ncbi:MAG: sulfatase [Pirellulales bacterium]
MTRVRLSSALAALLFASTAFLATFVPGSIRASSPNIVMIISDDHAWTDYSFQKHPHIQTPHLDKLAAESLTFTRGYVPSSLCCPSLVSMITGLYPHQHRITSNDPPLPKDKKGAAANRDPQFLAQRQQMIGFIDEVPTLPKLLGEKGYLSFQTGKWWQGAFRRGGFTHGMTTGEPGKGGRHGDQGLEIGRKTMQPIYDFVNMSVEQKKPFFVWYAPMMPHDPHTPPERLLAKYRPLTDSLHAARYWAMVEWFDETCGQLLGFLDERKLRDDTIVVYVTDNGWIQSLDNPRYAPKSKQSPYDGGLRTPIMIRWPGRIEPQMSPHLASSLDLAPTLLKAVGIAPPADLPGLNLLDAQAVAARKHVTGECFTHNAVDIQRPAASLRWRWIVRDDWKLIVPNPTNEPDGVVELYHLSEDPHETKNLADQSPDRVADLRRQLDDWWPAVGQASSLSP